MIFPFGALRGQIRAYVAAKTILLVFTECPLCTRHWPRFWVVAVNKTMRPNPVELTFRIGWGRTRQIKHMNSIINGKCHGGGRRGEPEPW